MALRITGYLTRPGALRPVLALSSTIVLRADLLSTASSCETHGEGRGFSALLLGLSSLLGSYWLYSYHMRKRNLLCKVAECTTGNNRTRRSEKFNFLAEAVERASPCVVLIEHQEHQRQQVPFLFSQGGPSSNGSGFIIDDGNYVLTNAHVVGSAHSVNVKLHDGRKLTGRVTDINEVADLALIKLDVPKGETLPALEFGSSTDLRPGEWVIALGSPLSLSNTITSGIVSCVHRPTSEIPDPHLQYQKPDMEYIQTDATITFGNSGGPLVNLDGEVIGINTMTAGPGISFAVPSDFAIKFLKTANRNVRRTTKYGIGISMLTVTPKLRPHFQSRTSFIVTNGVFLAEVWRGSPADLAGLRKHDIIVKMNSRSIKDCKQIYEEVQSGRQIEFEVLRGNEMKVIKIKPEPL